MDICFFAQSWHRYALNPPYFESSRTLRHTANWLRSALVLGALMGMASPQSRAEVFVSFDHIVLPPAARKDIDTALLYLRLKNNSRNPIQVLVTAPEGGVEGVEVVHEIVEDSLASPPASGWISPPGHYSPVSESTTADIQPNTDLLFSVPLNHVGPSWRLRIAYEISAPKASPGREQEGTVDFTWAGVPAKERGAWKK
jgi:hypothetical protein